jgi:hypothetical protein
MFVVHWQLRLAGQEALNAKYSQLPSLQLIKIELRVSIHKQKNYLNKNY